MTALPSALDLTYGRDDDADDVEGDGRSLSVVEIQQVLRELRARASRPVTSAFGARSQGAERGSTQEHSFQGERVPAGRGPRRVRAGAPDQGWGDIQGEGLARGGDSATGAIHDSGDVTELASDWIGIVAAHAGAGASTVTLALSDAAAAGGRRVHLIDDANPLRSGLVAAASEELGTHSSGRWRRGLRAGVTIDRRATDAMPGDWPVPPSGDSAPLTVVDLGLAAPANLTRLPADLSRHVVVCRPTVPGVRLTEQLLEQLSPQAVVIAAVGPRRWPGQVTASLGPRLRALWADGRVVPVPMDRHIQVAGPASSPLPRPLRSAGRSLLELLELLDDGHRVRAPRSSGTTANPASKAEETSR